VATRVDKVAIPQNSLARDIAVVVVIKLQVVIAAAVFVFGPKQRLRVDAGSIERRFSGASEIAPITRTPVP